MMNPSALAFSDELDKIVNHLRHDLIANEPHPEDSPARPSLAEILSHPNDPSEWDCTLTEIENYVRLVLALYAGGMDTAENAFRVMAFRSYVLSALGHFHYDRIAEDEFDFALSTGTGQHHGMVRFTLQKGTLSVCDTCFSDVPGFREANVRLKWTGETDLRATGLWYMDENEVYGLLRENPALIIHSPAHCALNADRTDFSFARISEYSNSLFGEEIICADIYSGMSALGKKVHDMWCSSLYACCKRFASLGVLNDLLQAEESHMLAYATGSMRNGITEENAMACAELLYVGIP